jgi:hypothetical protein
MGVGGATDPHVVRQADWPVAVLALAWKQGIMQSKHFAPATTGGVVPPCALPLPSAPTRL